MVLVALIFILVIFTFYIGIKYNISKEIIIEKWNKMIEIECERQNNMDKMIPWVKSFNNANNSINRTVNRIHRYFLIYSSNIMVELKKFYYLINSLSEDKQLPTRLIIDESVGQSFKLMRDIKDETEGINYLDFTFISPNSSVKLKNDNKSFYNYCFILDSDNLLVLNIDGNKINLKSDNGYVWDGVIESQIDNVGNKNAILIISSIKRDLGKWQIVSDFIYSFVGNTVYRY